MVNVSSKKILKNISFVVVANLLSTVVTAILSIYIPRVLDVSSYGFWQLNLLFTGYIAVLHFGWVDGTYIRYAGTDFSKLDPLTHKSQFWGLVVTQVLISAIGVTICYFIIEESNRYFAIATVFLYSLLTIPNSYLLYLLQGGGRIKEYSYSTVINKLIYISLSLFLFLVGIYDFKLIIIASLVGTLCSFLYSIIVARDIIFVKGHVKCKEYVKETFENITCGIKVSIAFISGNLIVGVIRFFIENNWGVETFGRASLSISLTHLIMIFINAVGIVFLPILRNVSLQTQKETYHIFSKVLIGLIAISFVLYYPLSIILVKILPQYGDSIYWMSLIFPICLFEARMGMLNNTYLKGLRKEWHLMWINICCALVTIILSYVCVFIVGSFIASMLLIVFMLGLRCTIADYIVIKQLGTSRCQIDIYLGLIFSIVFILVNYILKDMILISFAIMSFFVFMFFFFYYSEFRETINWIKTKISK